VDAERIGKAKALFERRVEPMFKKMPLGKVLRLLEEDPELRAALFRFIEKTRQSSGGSGAFMDLFLSEKHPEIRMLVASWCADHGGRFVDEWAMNSDETFLIFEELLRSAESE